MTLAWRSCPHCGATSAEQSRFCASCGSVFSPPALVERAVPGAYEDSAATVQEEAHVPLILGAIGIFILMGMIASGVFFVW